MGVFDFLEGVLDRDLLDSAGGFMFTDTVSIGFVSWEKLTDVWSILVGTDAVFLGEKGSSIGGDFQKSGSSIHFYKPALGLR